MSFPAKRRTMRSIALMLLAALASVLAGFPMPMAILIGAVFSATCSYVAHHRHE